MKAVEIFLPAEIVKASAGFMCKSKATLDYGAKPPNDFLQIANLQTQHRDDHVYAWALCTVGYAAICDEVICTYDDGARWPCLPYTWCMMRHNLPVVTWDGRRLPGLAWKIWVEKETPLQQAKETFLQVKDAYRHAWRELKERFIPFEHDTNDLLAAQLSTPIIAAPATTSSNDIMELSDFIAAPRAGEPMYVAIEGIVNISIGDDDGRGMAAFMEEPMEEPMFVSVATTPTAGAAAPVATPTIDRQELAEKATIVDEQMAAHVSGTVLTSKTVFVEPGAHVKDNRTVDPSDGVELGQRTARSRFPKMTEKEEYLFSANSNNLVAAEAMRNQNVGTSRLTPDQRKAFHNAVAAVKKHLFTATRCKIAEQCIERTEDVLPKKLSEEQKMQIRLDAMNDDGNGKPFSLLVDAFVKSEVTSKWKPRVVVNHGAKRLWGIAKASAIFEDILFHALPFACIKHCEKESKMNQLFRNCEGFRGMFENDMTAFEFGIHKELKQAEQEILREIMKKIDLTGDGLEFCERVVDSRDKCCTWSFRYRDEAGAECRTSIKLPRPVRESGDRITSSGNFLQNLLAWLTLLVRHDKVEAAVQSLLQSKGKFFDYVSPRDGKTYRAFLAFEGDDTLGALNESILLHNNGQLCDEFFSDHGWSAKMKVINPVGYDSIKFVGYTALVKDNKLVRDGENVVMFPEIKRILKDKAWATTIIEEKAYWPTVAIYATVMMNAFRHFTPMYTFFEAMRNDAKAKGGRLTETNAMLRDCYLREHGDLGTDLQVLSFCPEPEALIDGGSDFYTLAAVHAGPFTEEDAASMAGLTTLEYNGRDLACFVPPSWLD